MTPLNNAIAHTFFMHYTHRVLRETRPRFVHL